MHGPIICWELKSYKRVGILRCSSFSPSNMRLLTRNHVICFFFLTCFVNIRGCGPKGLQAGRTCDAAFWHAGDTDLNLIVTERPQKTPSGSQHLEFISRRDKHKYSHIILHKPPNTSYTPCCQRLGGLSPWDCLFGGGDSIFASRL